MSNDPGQKLMARMRFSGGDQAALTDAAMLSEIEDLKRAYPEGKLPVEQPRRCRSRGSGTS